MGGHTMRQDTGLHVYPSHQRNSDSTDKQAGSTANIVLTVMAKKLDASLTYSHISIEN